MTFAAVIFRKKIEVDERKWRGRPNGGRINRTSARVARASSSIYIIGYRGPGQRCPGAPRWPGPGTPMAGPGLPGVPFGRRFGPLGADRGVPGACPESHHIFHRFFMDPGLRFGCFLHAFCITFRVSNFIWIFVTFLMDFRDPRSCQETILTL